MASQADDRFDAAEEQAVLALLADQTTATINGGVLARRDGFANASNIESCCQYINQSLAAHGFPLLPLQAYDADGAAQVCNCVYSLLQQRQRDLDLRETAADQRQRLASDLSRCEAKVARLQATLEARERDVATLASKEQKAAAAWKGQVEKLKDERDEFQRMVTGLQQRQAQLQHDARKKEGQYARLQERLSVLTSEKKEKVGVGGMDMMTLVQKEGRQRGTWDGKKADDDFYRMIMNAHGAKQQELAAENAQLKDSLRHLQEEMQRLLRTQDTAGSSPRQVATADTPLKGRLDVFDLPYSLTRERIEQSLRAKMASLQERMAALQSAVAEDEATERELELDAQLAEARDIIQEQEAIIQQSMEAAGQTPQHAARLSRDLAAEVQLTAAHEDVAALRERIRFLEAERQQHTHALLQGQGGTPPRQDPG